MLPTSRVASSVLWTLCDSVGAWALIRIWRARQRVSSSSRDGLIGALCVAKFMLFLPTRRCLQLKLSFTLETMSYVAWRILFSPSLSFSENAKIRTFQATYDLIFEFCQVYCLTMSLTVPPRYLLNPYLLLPTLALSTATFENTLT